MEKKQYIKCNHCNFVTNDIQNKSGILKKHLESDHPNSTNKSNTLTHFTLKETHKDNDIKKIIFKPYIQDFYNKLKQLPLCFIYKIKEEYKLGTSGERILANKYRTTRNVVKQILKLTNIEKNNYGRLYEGGKNEADKRYYNKNKENIQQYHKDWYNENYYNGNLKEKQDKYRENNIERYRKNSREYQKKRCDEDPNFKLKKNIRTAVWQSLKDRKITYKGVISNLEYTIEDLKMHLEKQFKDGMSWNNYGIWHVDHKLPQSLFNFTSTNDLEFKKCWALDNLQPMWGIENISKGNKIWY